MTILKVLVDTFLLRLGDFSDAFEFSLFGLDVAQVILNARHRCFNLIRELLLHSLKYQLLVLLLFFKNLLLGSFFVSLDISEARVIVLIPLIGMAFQIVLLQEIFVFEEFGAMFAPDSLGEIALLWHLEQSFIRLQGQPFKFVFVL